jgi:acyl carrier protein
MSVQARLQQVFRETFDDDELVVHDELTAADVPDWDSLAHVSLIVAVEKEFRVRFTSAEVSALKRVGDLRRLVEAKLPA